MEKVVAQIKVEAPFSLDENSESAAAWNTIMVHPGTYDVVQSFHYGHACYSVRFKGTVTHAGYGNKSYSHKIGTESIISRQLQSFELSRNDYWGNKLELL